MDIMNTITTLLNNNLDIEPEQVTEDSTFDSLGIDSLDMVELICDLLHLARCERGATPSSLKRTARCRSLFL